jgi:hypothetical protein
LVLLDNRVHNDVSRGRTSQNDWLPTGHNSGPINGAWINPGGLALVHSDSHGRNPAGVQISIVDYPDFHMSKRPIVTHLPVKPHTRLISAITAMFIDDTGRRYFATGCVVFRN